MYGYQNPRSNPHLAHARVLAALAACQPAPLRHAVGGGYPAVGYDEIVGGALDELDSLDMHGHTGNDPFQQLLGATGAYALGAYPAVGLQELIGADPSPNDLAALAAQMQQARQIDPNAVVVRQRNEDTRRMYHMGFDAGADTAAGLAGNATQQPQVTIRPERLIVPSFIAPFFTIDNIIVGKDSQSAVGNNPVPASTYSEVAVGVRLNLKTANLGHLVTLAFTNVDTDPHRFRATMIGTATDVG